MYVELSVARRASLIMNRYKRISEHLSQENATAFENFIHMCDDSGFLARPLSLSAGDVCDGLNDATSLLRFMRARQFDSDAAFKQFKEAKQAHDSLNTVRLYDQIDIEIYESSREIYPHWSGRRDKRGMPICMFDVAHLNRTTMSDFNRTRTLDISAASLSSESIDEGPNAQQRALAFHDYLTRFVLPLCSTMSDRRDASTLVTSAVYLVDASSVGLRQAWDARNYIQDISKLLATSYPEVIDKIFVLNTPSYFATLWDYMKKWVDPATASKIAFLASQDVLPTLTEYIDLDNIPTKFGGGFNFEHGAPPQLDAQIRQSLVWLTSESETLPAGPIKWIVDPAYPRKRLAIAVGSVNGSTRYEQIAVLNQTEHDNDQTDHPQL